MGDRSEQMEKTEPDAATKKAGPVRVSVSFDPGDYADIKKHRPKRTRVGRLGRPGGSRALPRLPHPVAPAQRRGHRLMNPSLFELPRWHRPSVPAPGTSLVAATETFADPVRASVECVRRCLEERPSVSVSHAHVPGEPVGGKNPADLGPRPPCRRPGPS